MAELIAYIRDIERRLSPHLERFHDLVRHDPVLENPVSFSFLFLVELEIFLGIKFLFKILRLHFFFLLRISNQQKLSVR